MRSAPALGSLVLVVTSAVVAACGGSDDADAGKTPTAGTSSGGGGTSSGAGGGPGSGGAGSSGQGGGAGDLPTEPAPALAPQILLSTYVGGPGNQFVRGVAIAADGAVTAKGKAFTVTYDAAFAAGTIDGDANATDPDAYDEKPALYRQFNNVWTVEQGAKKVDDPRFGLTYYFGTQQVSNDLQQPIFLACKTGSPCTKDAFELRLWTWWASLAKDSSLNLQADSRGYDAWLMPGGLVGLQAWTDGGNSTLGRDPRRTEVCSDAASCTSIRETVEKLGWSAGTWQPMPNSMSTMYMTFDPVKGEPVRATFLRGSHVTRVTHDPWGRLYIPQAVSKAFPTVDPENTFGQSAEAKSGLFVLDREMKSLLNVRLGGACAGQQVLPELALRGNILVMGGTTCATDLPVTPNAVQANAGGGQDGYLVVVKLW